MLEINDLARVPSFAHGKLRDKKIVFTLCELLLFFTDLTSLEGNDVFTTCVLFLMMFDNYTIQTVICAKVE